MKLYQLHSTGEAVRDIQSRLNDLGYSSGDDLPGEYGVGTDAAVRKFQANKGLDADGIVGPNTWRDLVNAGFGLGDRLLYHRRPMIRGDDVTDLQQQLNALGFDAGKEDGIFGPDTLNALLDFQHNRHMAEDGICGSAVVGELTLMKRATAKGGRRGVAERRWLQELPTSVAGLRVLLDPAARTDQESSAAWAAVTAASAVLREKGAVVLISRSEDTAPEPSLRASRINRQGVDVILSFSAAGTDEAGCFYFASEGSVSEAGQRIAAEVAQALEVPTGGRSYPILRETRAPAVVVSTATLDAGVGVAVAAGLLALLAQPPNKRR